MRKIVILVAQYLGFLSFAEHQNNKLGSSLLDQFEKAINESHAHADKCEEFSIAKEKKANSVFDKAHSEALKLESKADAKRSAGVDKDKALRNSAKKVMELGRKSRRFAYNLESIIR